jgi:uncharacterized membrane protein YeaQ/YmgE (transglycosylase-associated protein family)
MARLREPDASLGVEFPTCLGREFIMSGVGIIGAIIIGILAGWIAEKVMHRNHGLITNLIVGLVGALLGSFVAGMLGIDFGGWVGSLIISALGAVLLLFILGLVKRPSVR